MKVNEMTEREIIDNLNKKAPPLYGLILDLSEKQQTPSVVKRAVEISLVNFSLIKNNERKTDEIVSLVLKKMGYKGSLKESIKDIILMDKHFFRDLPERLRDKEVCEIAIDHWGHRCLPFIPKDMMTEEMCQRALFDMNENIDFRALSSIPYPSACLFVLRKMGEKEGAFKILNHINPNAINAEVANEAVRQELSCIALIPPGIKYDLPFPMTEREKEDIKIVVNLRHGLNILPIERRTENVSLAAVIKDADILPFVPKNSRTDLVIETALKRNGLLISTLYPEERTEARQLLALKHLPYDLPGTIPPLPVPLLDEKICCEIVSHCPHIIKHLPAHLRTLQVCSAAYKNLDFFDDKGYQILPYIPVNIICTNLNKLGWQSALDVLQSISPEALNKKIIDWAIPRDKAIFKLIPADKLSAEHYLLQDKCYPNYFLKNPAYLPDHIVDGPMNIYKLNQVVEDLAKEKYSFKQIQDLYAGKRLCGEKISFDYNPARCTLQLYRKTKKIESRNREKKYKL